ncbi:MAG: InlB B-repeat-containing protein, partial [Coriobacteriia bacterium]
MSFIYLFCLHQAYFFFFGGNMVHSCFYSVLFQSWTKAAHLFVILAMVLTMAGLGSFPVAASSEIPTNGQYAANPGDHPTGTSPVSNSLKKPAPCYMLSISHTGEGSDPAAQLAKSSRCPQGRYAAGEVIPLSGSLPTPGWHIAGWLGTNDDLATTSSNSVTMPASNHDVWVNYLEDTVTLTLDILPVDGGSVTQDPPGPYHYGDQVELTPVPAAGYHFVEWTGDLTGSDNPASLTLDGDKTLTAVFSQQVYTLTVNTDGQGSVTLNPPGGSYPAGTQVELTAVPAPGWSFSAWSGHLSGSNPQERILMDGDKTVTAAFTLQSVQLTIQTEGSGTVIQDPAGPYQFGDEVQLTALPETGWHFAQWSGDIMGTDNPFFITLATDKNITAAFERDPITLTVNVEEGGSVERTPAGPYMYGDVVELNAVADTGWHFVEWSGSIQTTGNPISITLLEDQTLNAVFARSTVTLTVDIIGNGSVDRRPPEPYTLSDSVELTAIADPGWRFVEWQGDLTGSKNPQVIILNGSKNVTAVFAPSTVTLTVNVIGSGTVEKQPPDPYIYSDSVQLTAIAEPGWHFVQWTGDLNSTANPAVIILNGSKTVNAVFARNPVTLAVNISGSGAVNQDPPGPYLYGDVVVLSAVPAQGWQFDHWSGDLTGSAVTTSITLTGNKTVAAAFTQTEQTGWNDDFDNATVITSTPAAFSQDTTNATTTADDPVFVGCGSAYQRSHTIWYAFTPAASGTLFVDTHTSNFDTVLGV